MTNAILRRARLAALLAAIDLPGGYDKPVLAAYDQWSAALSPEADSLQEARRILGTDAAYASQPFTMMLLLHTAAEERDHGVWQRFPEEVYLDTMRAFRRFVEFYREATGEYGYGKGVWPLLHVSAKVFRIGELEYEISSNPERPGVHMHIPAGARLEPAVVADSLARERAFMQAYFPGMADAPHSCESWMLSPAVVSMLPEDSRIRWFAGLFDVVKTLPEEKWYLEFVFKLEYLQWHKGIDLTTLREDTALQRQLKAYLLAGGKPGTALGYLRPEARLM